MKRLIMLTLISCIVPITIAQVTLEVYEVDGEAILGVILWSVPSLYLL